MSLINDALKRARQLHKKKESESAPPPGSEAPLEPVEHAPKRAPTRWGLAGAVVLLGLGGWLFMNWWSARSSSAPPQTALPTPAVTNRSIASRMVGSIAAASNVARAVTNLRTEAESAFGKTSPPAAAPVTVNVVAAAATNQTPALAPAIATAPIEPKTDPGSETNHAAVAQSATITIPAASPPSASRSAAFPPLKLQGIYYRIVKPSVLINNRTLFVGDEIEGVRIVSIERFGATIEMGGKTRELTLK